MWRRLRIDGFELALFDPGANDLRELVGEDLVRLGELLTDGVVADRLGPQFDVRSYDLEDLFRRVVADVGVQADEQFDEGPEVLD